MQDRDARLRDHLAGLTRAAGAGHPEVRAVDAGNRRRRRCRHRRCPSTEGQALVTIEAMKMEHTMLASIAGTATITVRVGDQVALGQLVATVEPGVEPSGPGHERVPQAPSKEHHDRTDRRADRARLHR